MRVRLVALAVCAVVLPGSGCGSPADGPAPTAELTFNRDIAPIIHARCSPCHRSGQIGPFSLVTYEDVRSRARQVLDAVGRRVMPPWLPDDTDFPFLNARRLPPAEIERIERWAASGFEEGASAAAHAPTWPRDGWQLGTPDLVVELPEPYRLEHADHDVFRNFVLPLPTSSGRFVQGMEVQPGNPRVVHHITVGVDRTAGSRRLDEEDPAPGFAGSMFSEGAHSPDNHALGWTPGMTPAMEPAGMAWRLESGADLVLQLHMIPPPAGGVETVRPRVGLFFASEAPSRQAIDFKLGSKTIDIPAGESRYAIEDRYELPVAVDLLSIYPHAHYLAREMRADVRFPDGTVKRLIAIGDWNFRWQDQYRYAVPVRLPKGSVITMRYTYDNSEANPRNPHEPPRRVVYGPESSDEMGDLWLRLLPVNAADAMVLADAYVAIERQKNVLAAEQRVRDDPRDGTRHNALGVQYMEAGRLDAARAAFESAIRLAPDNPEPLHNLGQCLRRLGRAAEALAPLQRAIRLAPGNPQIQIALAGAFDDLSRTADAIAHYRRAIQLDSSLPDAHTNLGVALASLGAIDEAVGHFREAVRLRPDDPDARRNLEQAERMRSTSARAPDPTR
jgi:Flp pilus assembly protein TadD